MRTPKKVFSIILLALFATLFCLHLPFTYTALVGEIELAALYPWFFIELPGIPFVIAEIALLIWLGKDIKKQIANLVVFLMYIAQVIFFNLYLFL